MKKLIITSIALVAGVSLGYSQGLITIANSTAAYFISTNNLSGNGPGNLTVGDAGKILTSGLYDYTVLASSTIQGTTDADLANSSMWTWTGVTAGNSTTAGGIGTPNTTTSAAGTFGQPTGASYSTAPTEYYVILGWSVNEGTSWATVSGELANGTLVPGGYFGVSPVAYNEAGGGPNGLSPTALVSGSSGTGLAGSGLTGGFDLYSVPTPTPEPSTIALGVMGAASLLALRRKKA